MGAGNVLGALHQTRIHCTPHLKATDFSHLNFTPSVPLMLSLLHASSVSLEHDEAFFPCCMSDSFYNKGLINGSQVSNPLPSTIAQGLMRKWEHTFVAECLCIFPHVMLFETADRGRWSADYISDLFSDSGCSRGLLLCCCCSPLVVQQPQADSVMKVMINN